MSRRGLRVSQGSLRQSWIVLLLAGCVAAAALTGLRAVSSIRPVLPATVQSSNGLIVLSPDGAVVWTANPDSGSVTGIDARTHQVLAEIGIGGEPWALAVPPDGSALYALDRSGGRIAALDPTVRTVRRTVVVGPEPLGIGVTPDGRRIVVTGSSNAELVVVETNRLTVVNRIPLDSAPAGLAVLSDGRVLVTHARGVQIGSGPPTGLISLVDPAAGRVDERITIGADGDRIVSLAGAPTTVGDRAWIPLIRATPDEPRSFNTTVFPALTAIDLATLREDPIARIALSDEEIFGSVVNNPVLVVPNAAGNRLFVVAAGSNLVEVVDRTPSGPRLAKFLAAGRNPRGLALSPDGRTGYVMSYLSRSVTVLDLVNLTTVAEIPVTGEPLEAAVLRGKILFNDGADPRLTKRGWISCASCHPDGGHDGITWLMADGPRRTPPIWNGTRTLPWHWSAALDEAQDVEGTIRDIQQGLGLLPSSPPAPLGSPNAGKSADLDSLASYLDRGIRPPAPPNPTGDIATGRTQFQAAGCSGCHGGPEWTCSAPVPAGSSDPSGQITAVLRNVGTLSSRDIRGALGFRPPSLAGVALKAPYFHDGSMSSLDAIIDSGHPRPGARPDPPGIWRLFAPSISGGQRVTIAPPRPIVAFLRSISSQSTPISIEQRSASCLTGPF